MSDATLGNLSDAIPRARAGVTPTTLETPRAARAARRPLDVDAALGTAGMVLGSGAAVVGGVQRGALDMAPCLDGVFTSAVVATLLLLVQGHRPRVAILAVAPIVAIGAVGFFRLHPRPLAPLGVEVLVIGVIVLVAARLRAAL